MRFGERLMVFILRPIYRKFFKRYLWSFLAKVKTFFFAEVNIHIGNIELRFQTEDAVNEQRWASLEQLLRSLEASNAAQWDAMEQLLLALFRQPEQQTPDPEWKASTPHEPPILSATDLNRVHAASNIR